MPIVQTDVSLVLGQARAFYKGGDKSTNKIYLNPTTDEHFDRNYNAQDEDNDLRHWDLRLPPGADEGALLVHNEFTRGNCEKMAKVVRYYCERSGQLMQKQPHLYTAEVVIRDLFTHVFVVACERGVEMLSYPTIARMANRNPPAHGAWVIDCWLNVACPAPEFASRLRAKMDTWRAYGKVVINEQGKHFDNPDVLAELLVTNAVRYTRHL